MKNAKSPLFSETVITIAVLAALLLLVNPFDFIMTSALTLTLIMVLAAAMLGFGVFIWREQPRDEREALQSLQASRISYFVGAGVLAVGVVIRAFQHHLDSWLALAVAAMVLAKLVASAYNHRR